MPEENRKTGRKEATGTSIHVVTNLSQSVGVGMG